MEFYEDKPSYMENVCKNFGIDNKKHCVNWFFQANEHCHEMLYPMDRKATLWDMLQEILFDGQNFGLYDPNFMNRIPTYLSSVECSNFYMNLSNDYIRHLVPSNHRLVRQSWIMAYVLSTVFAIYIAYKFVYVLKCFVNKLNISHKTHEEPNKENVIEENVNAFKMNSHALNVIKYETKHLHVKREVTTASFCSINHNNLVLKVSKKLHFIDSIVHGYTETIGRFYNLRQLSMENGKRSVYTSTTTVDKVLHYINKFNAQPLQLWVIFDEEEEHIITKTETAKEKSSLKNDNNDKLQHNLLQNITTYTEIPAPPKIPTFSKVLPNKSKECKKFGSSHDLHTKKSSHSFTSTQRASLKPMGNERQQSKLRLTQKRSENALTSMKLNQLNMRNVKRTF